MTCRNSYGTIKFMRGRYADFFNENPVLKLGQLAYTIDKDSNPASSSFGKHVLKIGDGSTPWKDLPFATPNEPCVLNPTTTPPPVTTSTTTTTAAPASSVWQLTIVTTQANQNFSVMLGKFFPSSVTTPDLQIDWGDGTIAQYTTEGIHQHTYANVGTYYLKLSGTFTSTDARESIRFGNGFSEAGLVVATSKIPEILHADGSTGLQSVRRTFEDCINLTSVPADLFERYQAIDRGGKSIDFSLCFYKSGLTSIPPTLFSGITKNIDLFGTFGNCPLTSLPVNLFNDKVVALVATFQGSSITSIPQGFFDQCTNLTTLDLTFDGCSNLTTIPVDLFKLSTKIRNFSKTFRKCHALTSIPANLFPTTLNEIGWGQSIGFDELFDGIETTPGDRSTQTNILSTADYSRLLGEMKALAVANTLQGMHLYVANTQYTLAAKADRDILTGTWGWTILDGGLEPSTITGCTNTPDFTALTTNEFISDIDYGPNSSNTTSTTGGLQGVAISAKGNRVVCGATGSPDGCGTAQVYSYRSDVSGNNIEYRELGDSIKAAITDWESLGAKNVAISSDGSTLAIDFPDEPRVGWAGGGENGSVRIYRLDESQGAFQESWVLSAIITGQGFVPNLRFGAGGISLSANGDRIAIASEFGEQVKVFQRRPAGDYIQLGTNIGTMLSTDPNDHEYNRIGRRSLSEDGNTLHYIHAQGCSQRVSQVFKFDGTDWNIFNSITSQQTDHLVMSRNGTRIAYSMVARDANCLPPSDANVLRVRDMAPNSTSAGSIDVDGGSITLNDHDNNYILKFAMSEDGKTIAVIQVRKNTDPEWSGPNDVGSKVTVYRASTDSFGGISTSWVQIGCPIKNSFIWEDIDISEDGNLIALVDKSSNSNKGRVMVYGYDDSTPDTLPEQEISFTWKIAGNSQYFKNDGTIRRQSLSPYGNIGDGILIDAEGKNILTRSYDYTTASPKPQPIFWISREGQKSDFSFTDTFDDFYAMHPPWNDGIYSDAIFDQYKQNGSFPLDFTTTLPGQSYNADQADNWSLMPSYLTDLDSQMSFVGTGVSKIAIFPEGTYEGARVPYYREANYTGGIVEKPNYDTNYIHHFIKGSMFGVRANSFSDAYNTDGNRLWLVTGVSAAMVKEQNHTSCFVLKRLKKLYWPPYDTMSPRNGYVTTWSITEHRWDHNNPNEVNYPTGTNQVGHLSGSITVTPDPDEKEDYEDLTYNTGSYGLYDQDSYVGGMLEIEPISSACFFVRWLDNNNSTGKQIPVLKKYCRGVAGSGPTPWSFVGNTNIPIRGGYDPVTSPDGADNIKFKIANYGKTVLTVENIRGMRGTSISLYECPAVTSNQYVLMPQINTLLRVTANKDFGDNVGGGNIVSNWTIQALDISPMGDVIAVTVTDSSWADDLVTQRETHPFVRKVKVYVFKQTTIDDNSSWTLKTTLTRKFAGSRSVTAPVVNPTDPNPLWETQQNGQVESQGTIVKNWYEAFGSSLSLSNGGRYLAVGDHKAFANAPSSSSNPRLSWQKASDLKPYTGEITVYDLTKVLDLPPE